MRRLLGTVSQMMSRLLRRETEAVRPDLSASALAAPTAPQQVHRTPPIRHLDALLEAGARAGDHVDAIVRVAQRAAALKPDTPVTVDQILDRLALYLPEDDARHAEIAARREVRNG